MAEHSAIHPGIKYLSTLLQSRGVTIDYTVDHREGGAGPAEGITLILNNRPVTVPTTGPFVTHSPFSLIRNNGKHVLLDNGSALTEVSITPSPQYYALETADGIPYKHIALLHGSNCLASTVLQECTYWNTTERCRFCGIEISLQSNSTTQKKTPQQLLEVAQAASRLGTISHITLTAGSQADSTTEVEHLTSCCTHLKSGTDLPIHVQIMPPRQPGLLEFLKQSGADTIGIHVESFDPAVLNKIAPCKTHYSLQDFISSWRESVRLFGSNQVSSFIILGLGETSQSVIEGVKLLCDMGVYPFIVPLRPIPGTPLEMNHPPDPDYMISIYEEAAAILKRSGLSWKNSKAGCVRCGACSGLPDFEDET